MLAYRRQGKQKQSSGSSRSVSGMLVKRTEEGPEVKLIYSSVSIAAVKLIIMRA